MSASQANGQRQWLAVYTAPRHEKQVSIQLEQRAVECLLPLYQTVRRWKTGPALVSLPLFPGYVFAHVDGLERRRVLELSSVLKIVGNRFGPSPLPDCDIEALHRSVASGLAEPHPYLTIGNRVRVIRGPLKGIEGVLVRKKGGMKVVIAMDIIMQSVAVEVNRWDLNACDGGRLGEMQSRGPRLNEDEG